MADIITRYIADVSDFQAKSKAVEASVRGVEDTSVKGQKKIQEEINKTSKVTEGFNNGLKSIGTTIVGAFAVGSVINFGKQVLQVRAEFQKFEAVLTNTLGSQSAAQQALKNIQAFAASTPFSVQELTSSFVKLANQGFKPTTDEMRKLGDIASATGKGFDQLTEAIIDAQTGEFERLKEFGIRASKEGDKVTFMFKEQATTVDFTNQSIRDYLLSLGDLPGVSGASDAIVKTLTGSLSNLSDNWDRLLNTIGGQTEGVFSSAISGLNFLLEAVTAASMGFDNYRKEQVEAFESDVISKRAKEVEEFRRQDIDFFIKRTEATKGLNLTEIEAIENLINAEKERILVLEDNAKKEEIAARKRLGFYDKGNEAVNKIQNNLFGEKVQLLANIKAYEAIRNEINKNNKATEDEAVAKSKAAKAAEEKKAKELAEMDALALLNLQIKETKHQLELQALAGNISGESLRKYNMLVDKLTKAQEKLNIALEKPTKLMTIDPVADARKALQKEEITDFKGFLSEQEKLREDAKDKEIADTIEKTKAINSVKEAGYEADKANFEKSEKEKEQLEREIKQAAFDVFQGFVGFQQELNRQATDENLANLQREFDAKKITQEQFEERRKQILTQQAKQEKDAAIFNAVIATAAAIAKALPNIPLSVAAGILGGLQIAAIEARPIPQFAEGTDRVKGGIKGKDSVKAMLMPDEAVIKARENMKYPGLAKAWNSGTLDSFIQDRYIVPALKKQIEKNSKRKQQDFADNIAMSLRMAGGKFSDLNIIDGLKKTRGSIREQTEVLEKALKQSRHNPRKN